MNKYILLIVLFALVLMINLVSAGYYHDYYYPEYKTNSYKETIEFKKTTETNNRDRWNSEKVKTTVSEKTEISRTSRTPYYYEPRYSSYSYKPAPYSSWRYKEPYNSRYYGGDNYYYKPRYDYNQGYYNWRY